VKRDTEQISIAVQDVKIIKDMMQKSKFQLGMLSSLFLWYGLLNLSVFLISLLGNIYPALRFTVIQSTRITPISTQITPFTVLHYLIFLILFVIFFKKRRIVKNSLNEYTLNLFDIWGFILFVIPAVSYLISWIFLALSWDQIGFGFLVTKDFSAIAYASTMMGLLITGILLKNVLLKAASGALLLVYPLMPMLFGRFLFGRRIISMEITDILSITSFQGRIGYFVDIITIIALGIYFKQQAGGVGSGDK